MSEMIRKTRSLKVTEIEIPPEEKEHLAQLAMDPRYAAVLNVMERACIELDTALINVSTGDPEAILGAHAVSKAGWLFFVYVQRQVQNALYARTGEEEPERPSLEDLIQGVEV